MTLGIVFGLVGLLILFSATPPLIGDMIVQAQDSYVSNTTGCYIDQPAGTGDTPVEDFYCTGFDLMPLIIIGLFFAVIVTFVLAIFTGHLKVKL